MKRPEPLVMSLFTLLAIAPTTHADDLAVDVGLNYWNNQGEGSLQQGGNRLDLDRDLDVGRGSHYNYYLQLEHPFPVLPNIRIETSTLDSRGNQPLDRDISYGGEFFQQGTSLETDINIAQTDYVLYYQVLDSLVDLDLGLDMKHLDGHTWVGQGTHWVRDSVDGYYPGIYARVNLPFPETHFGLTANVSGMDWNHDRIITTKVGLTYHDEWFTSEAGYRSQETYLDGGDMDTRHSGLYASIGLHF